ncbi:MAG: 6-phosphofructo-2-kinase/fructose-2,6-bisphosphatase [Deltaproteobacteria bacterium]|nr:6-phosphofructo-2-kinase/fructose-2,6-bisphosphatase [Deltaproteobacteria bacterium]
MKQKLYIVMVGLPARGKSTTANKVRDDLKKDSVRVKIFNNGDLRRKLLTNNTSYAEFYNPENQEATVIRERISLINLHRAKSYIRGGGQVAILDATNATSSRRQWLNSMLGDHPILFIECINNNDEILDASIKRKVDKHEFAHLSFDEAVANFRQRITYYKDIYTPLKNERNIIRLDTLNKKVIHEEIRDYIPFYDQIRDFLVTDSVRHLYLVRHGETFFNLENRIGGDSDLTEKGLDQANALGRYFAKKEVPVIFTSTLKRTRQTAEPIKNGQKRCTVIPLEEFNEIDSGICECMSYDEIRETMPDVDRARKADKYNYVYPNGEGYTTMKERITMGINKVLYLSDISKNIVIVGHRAANRMILSHFLFRREEDVPYIYIPQNKFYYISVTQNKKLFQLMKYR